MVQVTWTRWSPCPYMVRTLKIFSYRFNRPMFIKLGIRHYVLKLYKVYINDDPELTLTHFNTMSNLAKLVFVHKVGPNIRWVFTGTLFIWFSSRVQKAAMSLKFSLRSVIIVRPSPFNIFFKHLLLWNYLANQSQISCGASMGRGTKSYVNDLGHMTKIVATPIYEKIL